MTPLDELLTPVTTDQQYEQFLDLLEAIGLKARSWRQGGALRTILRIVAGVYAGFSAIATAFIRAGFLEHAVGSWLTLLAFYVYGVTRIPATFATGEVTLTNSSTGNVFDVGSDELRVLAISGKSYTNVSPFILGPGQSLTIAVRAVEIGASSSAPPGTITTLETQMSGVTVTNAAAVVGSDEERDPDLRQRCIDKLGTLSGLGPRGAYAFSVRSATRPDGSFVDVNRLRVSPGSSTGQVTVYVASPSGAPAAEDLEYIRAAIELYARPDSVTATVLAATPVAFTPALTIWARRTEGLTEATL